MMQSAVMSNSVCFSVCLTDEWEMLPVLIPDSCSDLASRLKESHICAHCKVHMLYGV